MTPPLDEPWPAPVLVTGANGFIGSAVVRRLQSLGVQVRCLVRDAARSDRLAGLDAELVCGDVCEPAQIAAAVAGCRSVIHLAGPSAWRVLDRPDVRPTIVDGTRHVLAAARRHGIRRMVYVSSAAALGPTDDPTPRDERAILTGIDPQVMPYAAAKREAELLCREAAATGLHVVVVSPGEVFGPGDRDLITAGNLLGLLCRGVVLVCPGGTSIAHVDDAAAGIVAALQRGRSGERYLLGGENLSHRQLAELVGSLTGRRRLIVSVPTVAVRAAARFAWVCGLPFPLPPAAVPYATRYWHLDCRQARDELGVTFRTASETLRETLDWLRSAGHWR